MLTWPGCALRHATLVTRGLLRKPDTAAERRLEEWAAGATELWMGRGNFQTTMTARSHPLPPSCLNSSLGAISTTHLKKGPIAPGQEGVREFYLVVDAPPLNVFHEGKLDYFYFTSNTGGGC